MEAWLAGIEASGLAAALRASRWGYAAVSAAHVLGIAMLVGAILPLNLRLLGAWSSLPRASLARVLVPVAMTGLVLALTTGSLLFAVRAREYAALDVFQAKLVLIAAGVTSALLLHWKAGPWLAAADAGRLRAHAAISLAAWLTALACGRLIAFVG